MVDREPDFFSREILSARRFFRRPQGRFEGPEVVSGGLEYCSADFHIERESFPYVTLEFISAGKGRFILGTREYLIEPGTVMFYGPEHRHIISAIPREQLHKYFITVKPYREAAASPLYGSVFFIRDSVSILRSFEELIEYGLNPSPRASRLCSTIFNLMLQKVELSAIDYGETNEATYHSYVRCKSVITENYLEMNSLREAAGQCAVTEGYLCKLFARYDHQSPYSFLLTLRMNKAAEMIVDRKLSIKEVASRLGYTDQGHFSRAFKRVFGSPPSMMRSS